MNKEEITSQVHFLSIDEENEVNKIYDSLFEIENIIGVMDEMVHGVLRGSGE